MNNGFKATLIAAFLCIAALSGCATKPDTFTQKDPQADLYAFKTFAFYELPKELPGGLGYTSLVNERLKDATRAQLEGLGYVYSESNPDLRVNILLAVQDRAEIRSAPGAGPLPYMGWGPSNIETVEYKHGTLAIDLIDAHRRTMVWRGVAEDRISRKNLQNVDETVREVVRELFAKYPTRA